MSIDRRQAGLSLIELIVFIVIVSTALAGVLTVFNVTTQASADPMIRKQMLAIAEALLEEVQMQPLTFCDPDDAGAATAYLDGTGTIVGCTTAEALGPEGTESTRIGGGAPFDNVSDYVQASGTAISGTSHGLGNATTAITNISGTAAAPVGYTASIKVEQNSLNSVAAAASLLITVTVDYGGESLSLHGYRLRHSPNMLP